VLKWTEPEIVGARVDLGTLIEQQTTDGRLTSFGGKVQRSATSLWSTPSKTNDDNNNIIIIIIIIISNCLCVCYKKDAGTLQLSTVKTTTTMIMTTMMTMKQVRITKCEDPVRKNV